MQATFGDFTADPPRIGNGMTRSMGCHFVRDHLAIGAGGSVEFDFVLDDGEMPGQLTLTITALVSLLGESLGYAPIDVTVNGRAMIADFTIAGGALPRDTAFAVPGELLVAGANTLRLHSSAGARSMLWLYRITLDPSDAVGSAGRAMAQKASETAVFSFRTERRSQASANWLPAARLTIHVDRGEHSVPGQLAWRGQDGAEAAVVFQSAMTGFYGHHRAADGALTEYRGSMEERSALSEGTHEGIVHRFSTQEGWGGDWHDSEELRLLVEDGGAPVERVTWRDQVGNSGSLSLRATGQDPQDEVRVIEVRASDEFTQAGEVASNVLDDSWHKWLTNGRRAWLEFTLGQPVAVRHYVLASANDCADRDPEDWTLKGSHDGAHWVKLDSRASEHFPERNQSRGFTLPTATATTAATTATAFRHYRLEITRNAGSSDIQLSKVRFFTSAPGPAGFVGYYQRDGEGPIGYRGTSVSALPDPVTSAPVTSAPEPPTESEQRPAAAPERRTLHTVEKWRAYLAEYSADFMRVPDDEDPKDVAALQRATGRLLYGGADHERIAALEERLGTRLPPSYRAFLGTCDSRVNLSEFMWEMRTPENVDWFRSETGLWEMLRMGGEEGFEEETAMMDRALWISEDGDAQYWLLDPGDVSEDGEWAAYIWASWYPGLGERHASFAELVAEEQELRLSDDPDQDHDINTDMDPEKPGMDDVGQADVTKTTP